MAATAPSLASLLEQSRQLTSTLQSNRDIPHVELGLDQIESASRRLGGVPNQGYGASALGVAHGSGSRTMAVDGTAEGAWVHHMFQHGARSS